MKRILLPMILIGLLVLMFGCQKAVKIDSFNEFVESLEKMGFDVAYEDVDKDILEGNRKWLTLDGDENITLYAYEDNEAMEEDASRLDKKGFTYNNGDMSVHVTWVSFPHFYKKDNLIALYVGENEKIISSLKEIMGSQFSGYDGPLIDRGYSQVFTYNDFQVEITNIQSIRTEQMLDHGESPWEYKVISYYPGAQMRVLNPDMSDPTYSGDGKAHPTWGILLESEERIRIDDETGEFEIMGDMVGIYNLEASLFILKFEKIE